MSSVPAAALPLSGWENFYVIVGSSAAALTGLTFIVITIATDTGAGPGGSARARLLGLHAFITPTAVHFGSALGLSALLSVPGLTAVWLQVCLALGAVSGLSYCGRVILWMRRMSADYRPFLADWIWSAALPLLAYAGLLAAAALLRARILPALYLTAAVTLLLLYIGIHNAWDVVAWMTTERHAHRERERERERARRAAAGGADHDHAVRPESPGR